MEGWLEYMTDWNIGDEFFIWENGKRIRGKILEFTKLGECEIEWSDGAITFEAAPNPAGDWHKIRGRNENKIT